MLARVDWETEFAEWLLHVVTGHPSAAAGVAAEPKMEQPAAKTMTGITPEDAAAVRPAAAIANAGGEAALEAAATSHDAAPQQEAP